MSVRIRPALWVRQMIVLGLLGVTFVSCSPDDKETLVEVSNPLFVDPLSRDFSQNPDLLERIVESPHGYLRFINIQFTEEVCRQFADSLSQYPPFNLHGDAHLEQYAVTDKGRGLTDFDDSSSGPAVVDLVRFGVSLRLAVAAHGWNDRADEVLEAFLSGYRVALNDPSTVAPEPAVVARLQDDFEYDRRKYFEWVEGISDPVPESEQVELLEAMRHYFDNLRAEYPSLDADFLKVERIGYLKLGIGSALDTKYLVQIRGESDAITDDLVLELKQVRDLAGIECVAAGRGSDPYRILVGQSIAYKPYSMLGYVYFRDASFWAHAWVDNYRELDIDRSIETTEELLQVAYDVGVQLGLGHPNQYEAPLALQLRREQIRLLDRDELQIRETARALAGLVERAWSDFSSRSRP
ncbi:MAG: DUF2252 family protein [Thermoanaerobaculia bacterium]